MNEKFDRGTWNLGHPLALDSVEVDISDRLALRFKLVLILFNGGRLILGLCFHRLAEILIPEARIKVNLHDTAVLGHSTQHVIRHVSRLVVEGARRRMGSSDGWCCGRERLPECLS